MGRFPADISLVALLIAVFQLSCIGGDEIRPSDNIADRSKEPDQVLFPVCENDRWGFINASGEVVVPLMFLRVNRYSEGLACVVTTDGHSGSVRQGFIDGTGKFVIGPGPPRNYDALDVEVEYRDFHEGLAGFWSGDIRGKGGYIDKSGIVVIPPRFQQLSDFSEGLACVCLPRRDGSPFGAMPTGFIDKSGRIVLQPAFTFTAIGFLNGRCCISVRRDDGSWMDGFLDCQGRTVIPAKYSRAGDFADGLACVRMANPGGDKFGFIDVNGAVAIAIDSDFASNFSEGRACIISRHLAKVIDTTGRVVGTVDAKVRPSYVGDFSEGFADIVATVEQTQRSGFINTKGQVVIPIEYDHVDPFSGGLARVSIGPVQGYINRHGTFIWKTTKWTDW